MKYRVAVDESHINTAPIVEADGPAIAAAQYVSDNNMSAGTYYVQEINEAQEVTITITHEVSAKLEGVGGQPATVSSMEGDDGQ